MIYLDVHESDELESLLKARTEVVRLPLNESGYADIFWVGLDLQTYQIEMKSSAEILGNYDHVEGQLAKQYYSASNSVLLIRGVIAHHDLYKSRNTTSFPRMNDKFFVRTYSVKSPYYGFRAWIEGLDKAGIHVVEVPDMSEAVDAIMAMYDYSLKTEHLSLKRYYREKITLPEKNPHILALMYLSLAYDLHIGYDRAACLIEQFGTLHEALSATPGLLSSVKGIGKTTAKNLTQRWKQARYRKQRIEV